MNKLLETKKIRLLVFALLVFSILSIGQKSVQLTALAQEDNLYPTLISDSLFLHSPSISNFDVQEFLETQSGPLKDYYEEVEGELWSAAESIQFNAIFYGVNPQWIIVLLEAQNNLLTNPDSSIPTGFLDNQSEQDEPGFYYFVKNVTAQALTAYDGRRFQELDNQVIFSTGEVQDVPIDLNAGTFAVQSVFAEILTIKQWDLWVTGKQPYFIQQYTQWFGDPLNDPDRKNRAITSLPGGYILPFTVGETWYYTGGPHTYTGSGERPWSSIDIAPPEIIACPGGAHPAHRWLVAAKGGTVINSSQALVVIDHGDGWRTYYSHIATADRIGQGSVVNQGNQIGHPSCEVVSGGSTSGVHVHFSIWQAGTGFVDISGSSLSGWQIQETTPPQHYYGTMTRNGMLRTASTGRHDGLNDILNSGNNCCGCGPTRQSNIQLSSLTKSSVIGSPAPPANPANQNIDHFQRIRLSANQDKTLIPRAPGSFNKNQVLCDNDLLDVNSMSEADVQNLLNQRNSFFKDYVDPQTGSGASHIIYTEAQNNHISPKLILAKMQAESSSIWYWKDMSQLVDPIRPELGTKADWVLFYGWPDGTPPNPAYKGFYNQVHNAAQSLRAWYDDPGSQGWAIGVPHTVSDGTVTPVNATTIALYVYTPWISSNDLLWQVWWMMWGDTGCSDGSGGDCCGCSSRAAQTTACLTSTTTLNAANIPPTITPISALTSETALEVALSAPSDAPQKLASPAGNWQNEATITIQREAPEDALTVLRASPVDEANNQGDWRTIAQWGYDYDAPIASPRINNGSDTTRALNVRLDLAAEDDGSGVVAMRFSRDLVNWTDWKSYAPQTRWQLSNTPGEQTVYAQVRDKAGNLSPIYKTSIVVALNAPQPASTNYRLARSVIGMGGGVKNSSDYQVLGTSGQIADVGSLQSNNYTVHSGFWNPGSTRNTAHNNIYLPIVLKN